jgi:hypothetical protein
LLLSELPLHSLTVSSTREKQRCCSDHGDDKSFSNLLHDALDNIAAQQHPALGREISGDEKPQAAPSLATTGLCQKRERAIPPVPPQKVLALA